VGRPPPTDVDPFSPLSGQISPTSSGHIITALEPAIMSALSDSPDCPLFVAVGKKADLCL